MGKQDGSAVNTGLDLELREFKKNLHQKFNIAFVLMSLIPLLTFFYILVRLFMFNILVGYVGMVLFICICISLCGFWFGYTILKNILNKIIFFAAESKQASKAKSDFIANMSHELRTPLNSVLGFTQVLEAEYYGKLNEKQKEYIKDIFESGQYLLSLINDILDLSKIEAGRMELDVSKINLKEMLNRTKSLLQEKARDHSIRFELETSSALPEEIEIDERKVKQILFNFLSNAFKFTPDGGKVIVKVDKISNEEIEVSVIDDGPGIEKEGQKKLFSPFERLNSSKPGTGLGLALCKKMADLWDGRIGLVSPPEEKPRGCRFYFTIPIGGRL